MAVALDLRVNHVLCYLFSKFQKCDNKLIKQSILDYYTADEIHEAKEVILMSVSTLSNIESLAKIRTRRGDGRVEHEINDIFLLISELDEKQRLFQLPKFVSDSAEKMPSNAIVSGDLKAIMSRFSKMDSQISQLINTVNKLATYITNEAAIVSTPGLPDKRHESRTESVRPVSITPVNKAVERLSTNIRSTGSQPVDQCVNVGQTMLGKTNQTMSSWADKEFSSASQSCDDHSVDETWQTASSRKRRRIKTVEEQTISRQLSLARAAYNQDNLKLTDTSDKEGYSGAVRKPIINGQNSFNSLNLSQKQSSVLIGKKRPSKLISDNVSAAKAFVGKSIYCIDNVSIKANVVDIVSYVNRLGVLDVISCYEVQPRRSRWQRINNIVPIDRKAFRLCIPREDCDLILNEDAWPAHVSITAWRFNKKSTDPVSDHDSVDTRKVNSDMQYRSTHQLLHAATTTTTTTTGEPAAAAASDGNVSGQPSSLVSTDSANLTFNVKSAKPLVSSSPVHSGDLTESRPTEIIEEADNSLDMDLTIITQDGSNSHSS
jgi:hypothetical protein